MPESLRRELEEILRGASRVALPIKDALGTHLGAKGPVVLFGAGNLGRQFARVLLEQGIDVVAVCDNRSLLWGESAGSIPILSPADAVRRYGQTAFFVIAIWHPCRTSDVLKATTQLRGLGAFNVAPFSLALEQIPALLPRMFWSTADHIIPRADEIGRVFDLLADDLSRYFLLNALRLRLFHDFGAANHVSDGRQYFPNDVYRVGDDEVFVDCGAYDGDSMADFVEETRGRFCKIIAFEADPKNFEKLKARSHDLRHVDTYQSAVGAHDGVVRFSGDGVAASSILERGGIEVPCVTLETALATENPTIIKMDIEGAESEALRGIGTRVKSHNPVLAICIYHRPEDLWQLPLQMHSLMPESRLYMRSHRADGFDLVSYAIPPNRTEPGKCQ